MILHPIHLVADLRHQRCADRHAERRRLTGQLAGARQLYRLAHVALFSRHHGPELPDVGELLRVGFREEAQMEQFRPQPASDVGVEGRELLVVAEQIGARRRLHARHAQLGVVHRRDHLVIVHHLARRLLLLIVAAVGREADDDDDASGDGKERQRAHGVALAGREVPRHPKKNHARRRDKPRRRVHRHARVAPPREGPRQAGDDAKECQKRNRDHHRGRELHQPHAHLRAGHLAKDQPEQGEARGGVGGHSPIEAHALRERGRVILKARQSQRLGDEVNPQRHEPEGGRQRGGQRPQWAMPGGLHQERQPQHHEGHGRRESHRRTPAGHGRHQHPPSGKASDQHHHAKPQQSTADQSQPATQNGTVIHCFIVQSVQARPSARLEPV